MSRAKPPNLRSGHSGTTPVLERGTAIETPDAPDTLGEYGRELWAETWNFGHGIYHGSDYGVIERYCSMQEQRRQLLQIIEVDGLMSTGSTGQAILHPAFKAVHDINGRLLNIEGALGLTPEARARLGIATIEVQSKLDAFLQEGGPP